MSGRISPLKGGKNKEECSCFYTYSCFVQICTLPSGTGVSFFPDMTFSCVSEAYSGVFALSLWAKGQLAMTSMSQHNPCDSGALQSRTRYEI